MEEFTSIFINARGKEQKIKQRKEVLKTLHGLGYSWQYNIDILYSLNDQSKLKYTHFCILGNKRICGAKDSRSDSDIKATDFLEKYKYDSIKIDAEVEEITKREEEYNQRRSFRNFIQDSLCYQDKFREALDGVHDLVDNFIDSDIKKEHTYTVYSDFITFEKNRKHYDRSFEEIEKELRTSKTLTLKWLYEN